MKFITHNQDDLINTNMTSLRGVITCTYSQLVSTFGEPMGDGFDDYKSDAEWKVQFEDDTVATIYNWKNGKNYCGDRGLDVRDITEWHVGGRDVKCVSLINQAIASVECSTVKERDTE